MVGAATFDKQIKAVKAKRKGKREAYEQLKSTLVHFDPYFELMPGTKKADAKKAEMNPFAQEPPALKGE